MELIYLSGLMQRDDMRNLGLGDVGTEHIASTPIHPPDAPEQSTRI